VRYAFFIRVNFKIKLTQKKIPGGSLARRDLIPASKNQTTFSNRNRMTFAVKECDISFFQRLLPLLHNSVFVCVCEALFLSVLLRWVQIKFP